MTDGLLNAYTDYKSGDIVLVERFGDQVKYRRTPAEYSCFLKKSETSDEIYRRLCTSSNVLGVKDDGDYWRVRWSDRDHCRNACERLSTYDGDVPPIRRYLTDTGRIPVTPRRAWLDLEWDSRVPFSRKETARILCWVLVKADGSEIRGMLNEDTDEDEARLLTELFEAIGNVDQVLSWNGNTADFEVIKARTKLHALKVPIRRWLWLDHMDLFKRLNIMAAESGDEKQSMALDSVGMAVLGRGKLEFDSSKTWEAWATGRRQELSDYCAMDTHLMRDIELETGYVELFQTLCDVCGIFADSYALNPSARVEGLLFAIAKRQGFRFKTRLDRGSGRDEDKYKGAYVLHPTRSGIIKSVHVCDFSSLYPSIIITWNASPETKIARGDGPRPDYICEAPLTGTWFDTRQKGILSIAVEYLLTLRAEWQRKETELPPNTPEWHAARRMTTAYKIAVNAIYGVIGSPWSRFFDRDVAEAITQAGAWLIQHIVSAGEKCGLETIAGDTDSAFVVGTGAEEFRRFVGYCNEKLIPELAKGQGCVGSRIKLAYEKEFERLIIPIGKDGKGISKRYCAAIAHYKGTVATADSKSEVKGFEMKRGDSSRLTREMQKEMIDLFCISKSENPADFDSLCWSYWNRIMSGQLELDDVKISKALNKPLTGYKQKTKKDGTSANQPPHVEIAKILAERGREVGEGVKIDYVVVDGKSSPKKIIPAEDWTGEYDRYAVWETVWEPARRMLKAAFPGHDYFEFDHARPSRTRTKLESKRKQQSLLDWIDTVQPK